MEAYIYWPYISWTIYFLKFISHRHFHLSRSYCKTPLPHSTGADLRCCQAPQRCSLAEWTWRTRTQFSGHNFGTKRAKISAKLPKWLPSGLDQRRHSWPVEEDFCCIGTPSPFPPLFSNEPNLPWPYPPWQPWCSARRWGPTSGWGGTRRRPGGTSPRGAGRTRRTGKKHLHRFSGLA